MIKKMLRHFLMAERNSALTKKMNRTLELFIMGTCLSVYLFIVIMAPVAYYVYAYHTNHKLLFLIVLPPLYFYILAEFCESMNYIIITCEKENKNVSSVLKIYKRTSSVMPKR